MPAPSDLHEAIVNDVWEIFPIDIVKAFGSAFNESGVMFSEPFVSHMVMSIANHKNRKADFYFDPYDGHGPIVGEVGERTGFDRSLGIINPRFSEKEIGVLKIVQDKLWHIRFKNEI